MRHTLKFLTPLVDIDLICFCDTLPVHIQVRQPFLYFFARPQCVPNNHQRANFREEEVQRVQEEILLRHAGRCTALLKDAFQPNALLSWTRRLDRSNTSGRRPLGDSATFPTCSKCCRVLHSEDESDPLFSKPFLCFKKLRGISYCQYLPALFVSVNNIQCILISFMFYSVW